MKSKKQDYLACLIFLGPSLLGFALFYLIPFLGGLYYSLIESPNNHRFVGLLNYANLFQSTAFLKATSNTLIFTAYSVPIIIVVSLGLALLLNRNVYYQKLLKTVFVSSMAVPVASVAFFWQMIFDVWGPLNYQIMAWGGTPVDWLNTFWARIVILIVYLWKNLGYNMVLFLAGLQNIPKGYYELAKLEGANPWQQFLKVTLVYLTPTLFFVLIISIINSFKVFRETYLIAGNYPHDSLYMLQHYINNNFMVLDYQKLTAAALVFATIIYFMIFGFFRIERRLTARIG
ncbi:MAG: sugar ABC transporter permease [Bacillota bacterium]|jgi:multiple sugar transport system permease protein